MSVLRRIIEDATSENKINVALKRENWKQKFLDYARLILASLK